MADFNGRLQGVRPLANHRGHPMPRRAPPETSVTLIHHRLARDASMRPEPASNADPGGSPRRNSSGESHYTGQSDPKKWFDLSNRNPPAAFDHATMDVDPPFFQKQVNSYNEELNVPPRENTYPSGPAFFQSRNFRPMMAAHSSSAEDYRSVIDDLTIENKRLKEELRRHKKSGPDLMKKDKLFEIKVHGLPREKKRELEATLHDFAASLEGSTGPSSQRKKSSKHAHRLEGSSSNSKHASSSSSHSRPVDSAYASMSTGPSSVGPTASSMSLGRPSMRRAQSSVEQKEEKNLQDIPEGLLPHSRAMTDREKKKLVVRRLEQLFTGKNGKKASLRPNPSTAAPEPQISGEVLSATPQNSEPSREALILLHESGRMRSSGENMSVSNSNGENETGGNDSGSGINEHNRNDYSPQIAEPPEQRATRPRDLDPDRLQIPSENMQYIRHLGVMAPEYVSETKFRPQNVSMDAQGWIHLNLLCNLAQLHILNVTPDYIRSAVSEKSAKFQLSRDGRKIRWRGGTEGTRFSSDSSGDNSQRSPDNEATDGSNGDGQRKRQRTSAEMSGPSNKTRTKLGPQNLATSDTFHYKPLFIRNQSSSTETSMDETGSQASYVALENSNLNSRSTGFVSGSGSSPRKKRRNDGAIVYYTGAPFCTDLSGDPGDVSPTTYMTSTGQERGFVETEEARPDLVRTLSGSSLPFRPLFDGPERMDLDATQEPEFVCGDTVLSKDDEYGFCWCDHPQKAQPQPLEARLEPCGLGGVTPEDHFAILVVNRHPINTRFRSRPGISLRSDKTTDSAASRIAGLTNAPHMPSHGPARPTRIQIQFLDQKYKALKPLPLPPPMMFYPPFTEATESEDSGFEDDYTDGEEDPDVKVDDSEAISQLANPHESGNEFARMTDLGSDDDDCSDANIMPGVSPAPMVRRMSRVSNPRPSGSFNKGAEVHPDSSGATAGGEESGYSSSEEEEEDD